MKVKHHVSVLLLVFALTGCAQVRPLSSLYAPGSSGLTEKKVDTLLVLEPAENRPLVQMSKARKKGSLLPFIPLVPFAHQQFTPERVWSIGTKSEYLFRKDLGETIANDLRTYGIARRVVYVEKVEDYPLNPGEEALILQSKLSEGCWNRYNTTYGFSVFSMYLHLIGAPVSYGNVTLQIDFTLKDTAGGELGRETFKGVQNVTEWMWPYDRNVAVSVMRQLSVIYDDISHDMRPFISNAADNWSDKKEYSDQEGI